jgi:hypothetical protein
MLSQPCTMLWAARPQESLNLWLLRWSALNLAINAPTALRHRQLSESLLVMASRNFGQGNKTVSCFAAVPAGVKNNKKRGKYLWPGRCSAGQDFGRAEGREDEEREKKRETSCCYCLHPRAPFRPLSRSRGLPQQQQEGQ